MFWLDGPQKFYKYILSFEINKKLILYTKNNKNKKEEKKGGRVNNRGKKGKKGETPALKNPILAIICYRVVCKIYNLHE